MSRVNFVDFNKLNENKELPFPPVESNQNRRPDFIGSYPQIAKSGENGPFMVNTYLLQPNRKMETLGPVTVRSHDLDCKK